MSAPDTFHLELIDVIGPVAAVKLIARFGGTRLYIPARMTETHVIAQTIGIEEANRLSDHFVAGSTGLTYTIPMGRANNAAAIDRALKSGLSVRDAARAAGVHERTVYRHKKQPNQSNQPDLFLKSSD